MAKRVSSATRSCVFCGGRPLTREHIWPEWIISSVRKHLGPAPVQVARLNDDPYVVPELNATVKVVCAGCNNGWMSELETRVRPALEPMILGRLPVALTPVMQAMLARWAFKTAVMIDLFKPSADRDYGPREYRMLKDRHLFSGMPVLRDPLVMVWTAAYQGPAAGYSSLSSAFPFVTPPTYTPEGIVATPGNTTRGVSHTLRLMHVLFQVLVVERGAYPILSVSSPPASIRLAPPTRTAAEWPFHGEAFGDADIDKFVKRPVQLSLITGTEPA